MLAALYGYLVVVGVVALALVVLGQLRAATAQTAGRLHATLYTLAGLIVAGTGRITGSLPSVVVGLVAIDIGLTLYVLYLPNRGLLQLIGRLRQRKDHGGDQ